MRKIFLLFVIAISLNCAAQIAGDGTSENPYLISSAEDLCYMRDMVNSGDGIYKKAYYKQTCDIVLNESLGADNINEWIPIGNSENPFMGVYDGSCFQVKGLYINNDLDNQGLFGVNEGAVCYLGLSDSYISADAYVGGIVGYNYGEISYCYNESHINGVLYVGGICGYNRMHIQYCYNLGCVEGLRSVGGVNGANVIMTDNNANGAENSAIVKNCYNAGNVKGDDIVAGISAMENFSTLENCFNIGFVDNGYPIATQYYNSGKLYYDNSLVVTTYIDSRAKGLAAVKMIGINLFDDDNWACNEELYPQISCIKTDKSLLYATPIFLAEGQNVKNILSDFKVSKKNGVEWSCKNGIVEIDDDGNVKILSYGEDILIAQLGGYVREIPINVVNEPNVDGVGTRVNPYEIANVEEFVKVIELINSGEPYNKMCYKVTGNLVFNRNLLDKINNNQFEDIVESKTINSFAGVFDFNMFFIQGLYINSANSSNALFKNNDGEISGIYMVNSYINGGDNTTAICSKNKGLIKSCIVQNSFVKGGDNTAAICSINEGEINTCWNQANVMGDSFHTGGISAYNNGGKIINCRNDGSINGEIHIGGICSKNIGSIEHCVNKGNLLCEKGQYIGGIAAVSGIGKITYCVNSGCLQGPSMVAGIVAYTNFSDVSNCYNIGTISSYDESSAVAAIVAQSLPAPVNCFYDVQTSLVSDASAKGLSTIEFTSGNVFNDNDNWYEEKGVYPQFSSKYLSIPDIYPVFLSNYEKVNNVCSDFVVHPNATYTSRNNRVQFDEEGNARISSVGEDTIIVNNSWVLPIRITENPNEIVKTGRYYTLCDGSNKYLSANIKLMMADYQDNSTIFYLDGGNGLLSYRNGLYINSNADFDEIGQKGVAVNLENGTVDNSVLVGLSDGLYLGSDGYEIAMTESCWIVEEVNFLPVTITSVGYTSFYAPVEVTLPYGVYAYYITSKDVNDGYVSLTMIEDGIVPANTGVILAAENPAIYNLAISKTGIDTVKGNLLKGTAAATNVSEKAYVLYDDNGNAGLYLADMNQNNSTAFKNNSHKAYLPVSVLPTAMQGSAGFRFDLPGLTAVEELEFENRETKIVHDLMGRRINSPVKGIYIINGKKVIIK